MNNSVNIAEFQEETDNTVRLTERQAKLVRILEALDALQTNAEWSTLKEELFDSALGSIENRLKSESNKPEISLPELYRLQGERKWALKYSDLGTLRNTYRKELETIRKQMNPGTAPLQA